LSTIHEVNLFNNQSFKLKMKVLIFAFSVLTISSAQMMPFDFSDYSIFDINGVQDSLGAGGAAPGAVPTAGAFGIPGAVITPGGFGGAGAAVAGIGGTPVAGSDAAKPPIYRQLPSKVAPVQTLPTVTNYRFIQQPVIQQRNIEQPINQKRYIVQPVILGRTIYQPLQQKIGDQTIVQPQVTERTAIYPHVIEQPVLQKQYQQQDTYVQTYQQTHGVQPTQTQPATFTAEPPQTVKGGAIGGAPTGASTPVAGAAAGDP